MKNQNPTVNSKNKARALYESQQQPTKRSRVPYYNNSNMQ